MNIGHTTEELESKICQLLKWKDKNSLEYSIVKRSIDARKKTDIYYSYVIHIAMKNEQEVVKKLKNSKITAVHPVNYQLNATV